VSHVPFRLAAPEAFAAQIPNELAALMPPTVTPRYRYAPGGVAWAAPIAQALVDAFRAKKSPEEVMQVLQESWLAAQLSAHGSAGASCTKDEQLALLVPTLLHVGAKTMTHATTVFGRYAELLRSIASESHQSVFIVQLVYEFWMDDPHRFILLCEYLLVNAVVSFSSIVAWIFTDRAVLPLLTRGFPWELLRRSFDLIVMRLDIAQTVFASADKTRQETKQRSDVHPDEVGAAVRAAEEARQKRDAVQREFKEAVLITFQRFSLMINSEGSQQSVVWREHIHKRLEQFARYYGHLMTPFLGTLHSLVFSSSADARARDTFAAARAVLE
jgi:hypothetical protein